MKTDKEYIEKIVSSYKNRKKIAILFGVVGVAFGIAAYLVFTEFSAKTLDITSSLNSLFREGKIITAMDIRLIESNNTLSYVMGMRVGQLLNSLAFCSGLSLGYCLNLLFGARKERIICDLYEKSKSQPL